MAFWKRTRSAEGGTPPPAAGQDPLPSAVRPSVEDLVRLRLEVGKTRLRSRLRAASALTGTHPSHFRGRGMDYQESRVYQAGDDIRNMDWRVTARAGHPHTKLYREERERPVVVLVDLSPTMFFGSRGALKSVIATRAAAFIGWVAVAHHDRIGALIFNGDHREIQPRGGNRGALHLIQQLVAFADPLRGLAAPARPGAMNRALRRLHRVARPGSLIVLLSDFYDLDAETGVLLTQLRRHNDVLACRVLDALEQAPPPPGYYPVTDGEHRGILDTATSTGRQRYLQFFDARRRELAELLNARAIPWLQLGTDGDTPAMLRDWLQQYAGANGSRRGRAA